MEHGQVHHPRDGNNFKRNIRYFEERDVKKRKENSIRNNFGIVNVVKRNENEPPGAPEIQAMT